MRKEEEIKFNKQKKRLETLILKKKATLGTIQGLTNFKEPVGFLIRRNREIEFYENLTGDRFNYEHSNGEERYIELSINQLEFPYAGKKVRTYIMQEDNRYPLPNQPILEAERIEIAIEKVSNDFKKWSAKEWEAKGDYWWKIALGIAVVIGVYVLAKLVLPSGDTNVEQSIAQPVVQQIAQNISRVPPEQTTITILQ